MAISLKQVAQRAGVSDCTASKVLSSVQSRISPDTRERVLQAAHEMGYVPNRIARSLGRGRTETLGLMISGQANPFFTKILEALETESARRGYQTIVDSAPSARGTFGGHGKLRGWPVDGALMWSNGPDRISDYLGASAAETPVVYLGGSSIPAEDVVSFDGCEGVRQAITHLLAAGRRRIAYVAPYPNYPPYHDARYTAYTEACREAGIRVQFLETSGHEETRAAGLTVGTELAECPASARPDALLCHNDILAVGINCGLRRAGVRVPDEIAVVGQEGIDEGQFLVEPLTTVSFPVQPFAEAALRLLLRRIQGDDSLPEQVVIPTTLLVGKTT